MRNIPKDYIENPMVMKLSDNMVKLFYLLLVSTTDRNGVTEGDPDMLRAITFKGCPEVTAEVVTEMLTELQKVGLVQLYVVDDNTYCYDKLFEKFQRPKKHERAGIKPMPPGVAKPPIKKMKPVDPAYNVDVIASLWWYELKCNGTTGKGMSEKSFRDKAERVIVVGFPQFMKSEEVHPFLTFACAHKFWGDVMRHPFTLVRHLGAIYEAFNKDKHDRLTNWAERKK